MRKNTDEQKEERLQTILSTACRLFEQSSISEVSVLDICRACNITKPTFYRYVDSKESLLVHYFDDLKDVVVAELDRETDPDNHAERVILAMIALLNKVSNAGTDMFSNYMSYYLREHLNTDPFDPEVVEYIVNEIGQAQKTGQIRNMQKPEDLVETLTAVGEALCFHMIEAQGEFDLAGAVRQRIECVLDVDRTKVPRAVQA